VPVPFFVDVFIGERFAWSGDKAAFMAEFDRRIHALAEEGKFPAWD
jgi:hypothetical protein